MNQPRDLDPIIASWLDDGPIDLPADTRRAIVVALRTQPRARRVAILRGWPMNTMTRVVAAAAVLLAVGGLSVLVLSNRSQGVGGPGATPTPTATPAASAAAGATSPSLQPGATSAPSQVAPGIAGWTDYTSDVYRISFGYPNDWTLHAPATRRWQAGDEADADAWPYADTFAAPEGAGGDGSMGLWVWQMQAGSGADISSRDGLVAWAEANLCGRHVVGCQTASDVATQVCVGRTPCGPAVLVALPDGTSAFSGDARTGIVTIVELGRPDAFPAAARYGGTVQLLKSILATMDL